MPQAKRATPAPSFDELRERAEALVPVLRERAAKTEALRRIPDETIADLHRSGLFRMLQPARVGGSELPYGAFVELAGIIGRGCWLDRLGAQQSGEPSLDARLLASGGAGRDLGPVARHADRLVL